MQTVRFRSLATVVALVALVCALLIALRRAGDFERLELAAYDAFVQLSADDRAVEPRIAIVQVTEEDIQQQRAWPLSDRTIAALLTAIARQKPRAIGLDIYRDLPVPPGGDELDAVLGSHPEIFAVMHFGGGRSAPVSGPAALADGERVGFNDFILDRDGAVRRAILFLDDGDAVRSSLALRLALRYLEAEGIGAVPDAENPDDLRLGTTTLRPFETNDGAYVDADAQGYQLLLDFAPGPSPFATHTLGEVLGGTAGDDAFRDRIVVIGVAARSVKDTFQTPYSRGSYGPFAEMDGAVVHAHQCAALLRAALDGRGPRHTPGDRQEDAWTLLWGLLGGLIGFSVRSAWRFAAAMTAAVSLLVLAAWYAFAHGWWIPVVPPAAAVFLCAAVVAAYATGHERRERRTLMDLFERHVAPEVAESIWAQRERIMEGGRLRSQRLTATVMFTDLVGFTGVSEQYPPDALMAWLNEYMEAMAEEVMNRGGVIDKYVGDAIMTVFGVPAPRTSETEIRADAIRAVDCALGMRQRLERLNDSFRARQLPLAMMRVGIHTGPVVVGSLGSSRRMEYTVIGDTVNTAARIESHAQTLEEPGPPDACRILVGDTTAACLDGRYELCQLRSQPLKGKSRTVEIFRVLGHAAGPGQQGGLRA